MIDASVLGRVVVQFSNLEDQMLLIDHITYIVITFK